MKIQDFSYHTHSNAFNAYDAFNTTEEMVRKAEEIGYSEIGVSNHLIFHPNMPLDHRMFFNDYNKALDLYKRTADEIREVGTKSKIKVYLGWEVDYFPSAEWRKLFEKLLKELDYDYLIGSNHYIWDKDLTKIINLYRLFLYDDFLTPELMKKFISNHWDNLAEIAKSGYFDFIGHLDVIRVQGLCVGSEWDDKKMEAIEAIAKHKHPYELNTSGITKTGEQHPAVWMLKELQKRNVPIVISDDAHKTEQLGAHYETAEKLLQDLNYTNRWRLNK
ncbi:MAG: PHP domain-containing protein [Lactobacillaceae bacterium]|jgi:histidinol-phosphatase (PHP family)|nr:PHP domain-containing protein [Lactobacillaceae bacterium]